jgi:hypothetical protein
MAKHRHGGAPLPQEFVVSCAAVPSHDLDKAKDTFEKLRTSQKFPFVENNGKRGILLNNNKFSKLVDFLRHECGWSPFKINNSLRHYDVYKHHDFN